MNTFYCCDLCYRQVRATRSELVNHADGFHYGQSIDLVFPGHGLDYKPMDPLLKRQLVARGEARMGHALIGSEAVIFTLPYEIIKSDRTLVAPTVKPQMRPIYGSDAWAALVCQGWVTIATELATGGEIAVMEKF
jgi:hypothetical protein